MTRWLWWFAFGLVLSARSARAEDFGPFGKAPEVTRLDNGLTVVTVPWQSPGIIAYYTLVRVGSRDEVEPGHSGFAHLFEHMMFRGTEKNPEKVYEAKIQRFGADNNAYTTQDFTLYTVTAPSSALAEIIALEADRFQHLTYSEQQFRTETGAVLGEYNKSASSPFLKMWEALSELSFTKHTYGHTTIGYLADIKAMPDKVNYARSFFKRFYTPDNSTIIVAGDVVHGDVVKLVMAEYAAWKGTRDNPVVPGEPEAAKEKSRHLDWDGISPPKMLMGYRSPAFCSEKGEVKDLTSCLRETAALEVVHGLLFSESSRLYQELVLEKQKLLDFGSWPQNFSRDPGLFVVSAELKPNATFNEIEDAVQGALDELAQGKLDEKRLAAVRSNLRYSLTMNVETANDAADTLAQFIAVTGRVNALPAYIEALSQVTLADVKSVAQKYLTAKHRNVVTLAAKPKTEAKP